MALFNAALQKRVALVTGVILVHALTLIQIPSMAQSISKKKLVQKIMKQHPEHFQRILEQPEKYRVQVLYTQIDRDQQNRPHFKSYAYRLDPKEYFYPASTVKLPAAALALEKLNELNIDGLNKYTSLKIDSAYSGQSAVLTDSSSENNLPSIAHYIKKVLLVSDNDAYNRLYEFLGQKELNEGLHEKGFEDVRLSHRLSIFLSPDENSHTNPFTFFSGDNILYQQPMANNANPKPSPLKEVYLGKGYMQGDKLVNEPMDFSAKNYISVEALQGILKSIMFPEAVPAQQRFNLKPEDYTFLYKYMSMLPRESDFPEYEEKEYPDSYVKFLMYGQDKERIPQNIRIFNKIGDAYGFMIDNAYVVDFENKVEFMLTAVIYVNEDEILNDGKYEYDAVGFPFMKNLGKAFYQYELNRKKKNLSDLSKFKLDYE
ncbi:serine hydrolase [Pontibacter cellulosilyticus]|uniref:Serine hydrolase n=1 Tax=Pontibacter cellulosilyticus TaxID=1720253 RepID=A0A923N4T7_9BACT|nr:serine hydrolase [Pontibacter cellulosilyticus]MBC5992241.1 serine hydrolase [Pontibacter cellulosilyticus]